MLNWNIETRKNLFGYLEGNIYLLKTIVNYYEDVIVLGKYIYLSPKSSQVCKEASEKLVTEYIFKDELIKRIIEISKTLVKIRGLRRGFYCALCSVKNQKFFNTFEKKLIFSHDFCEYLVENSIE